MTAGQIFKHNKVCLDQELLDLQMKKKLNKVRKDSKKQEKWVNEYSNIK